MTSLAPEIHRLLQTLATGLPLAALALLFFLYATRRFH